MSWREFLLRQIGYQREQKNEWYKVREIAYCALVGSHQDPKKLPKNKENFIPLDGEKKRKGVSAEAKQKFIELYKKWQNERKHT
jgi:hypothetical protein